MDINFDIAVRVAVVAAVESAILAIVVVGQ